ANHTDLLGLDELNPKDPVNQSHSHHSDDDSDGPITQASTRASSKRATTESIVLKLRSAPSQVEAMKIFNALFTVHFTNMLAATAAIKVFENKYKCQTFINPPNLLQWSWLAGELGFSVVEN
ncbi:hypothetical protein DFH28DRAFT_975849, partial [Melampsora americana]